MTFQQLTYVVEISKCGSINKAAHKLFLSQSGISTAVRELEEELGIKFFVRSNRGVEFTPEGKEFLSYAVSLLEQKGYDPLAYRFFCLQSHYRKGLLFSWENLDNATVAFNKLLTKIAALKDEGDVDQAVFDEYKAKFMKAMDNDLNTSMGVTVLYDVLKAKTNDKTKLALLDSFDTVLGLKLLEKAAELRTKQAAAAPAAGGFTVISESGEEDAAVEQLIRARADAKKAKNFAEADRIRDELKAQGIEVTDVPGGAKWKRI